MQTCVRLPHPFISFYKEGTFKADRWQNLSAVFSISLHFSFYFCLIDSLNKHSAVALCTYLTLRWVMLGSQSLIRTHSPTPPPRYCPVFLASFPAKLLHGDCLHSTSIISLSLQRLPCWVTQCNRYQSVLTILTLSLAFNPVGHSLLLETHSFPGFWGTMQFWFPF